MPAGSIGRLPKCGCGKSHSSLSYLSFNSEFLLFHDIPLLEEILLVMSLSPRTSLHESLHDQPLEIMNFGNGDYVCLATGFVDSSTTSSFRSGIPKLDTDAIAEIMKHIKGPQELSFLMRTCHVIYAIGVFPLLQLPIYIRTNSSLVSFRNFLFADPCGSTRRFEIIRSLNIHLPQLEVEGASSLAEILARSSNLRKITISNSNHFFDLSPDANQVLANLTRLIKVTLKFVELKAISWLQQTKSPLSELNIIMPGQDDKDLFPVFSRFSNSLTKLDISDVRLTKFNAKFVYLRDLKIHTQHPISAVLIAHAFPNLESLDITIDNGVGDVVHQHAVNSADLSSSGLSFPSLQCLKGSPEDLFSAGIEPRAKIFRIDDLGDWNIEWFFKLLRRVQPSTLGLPINTGSFEDISLVAFLESLFKEHLPTQRLCLFLHFGDEKNKVVKKFIVRKLVNVLLPH